MRKISIILVFIMLSLTIFGQNIIIDFAGEGASTEVTTVEVVNLSNCTSITVASGSSLNLTNYNNEASLSDLTVSGSTVNGFVSTTLTYDVELPLGTTEVPAVDATPTDINATYEITDATELPGSTTIIVTAEDGETEQTYTVNFTIVVAGEDASLLDLTVNLETVENFVSTTLTYDVELPLGTTEVPAVDATPTDINATYEITDASELPGSTTILVTAEDGETEQTYTINFTVATGIANNFSQENLIKSYPNPFNSSTTIEFYVNQNDNVQITVCDIAGKIITQNSQSMTTGIHSYEFTASSMGMYFINVSGNNFVYSSKVICISDISQGSQLVYKEQISNNLTDKTFFNDKTDETEVISQIEKDGNSKDFSFTEGDTLLIKGISGDYAYATVMVIEPTVDTTYTFNFVECTDNDGNNYAVVVIGEQTWMAENIKTTSYVGGGDIPLITVNAEWVALGDNDTDKAYCFYDNDENSVYGALYTYAAAINGDNTGINVQGVCPTGWHMPSDDEWTALTDGLGGLSVAGGKLKSTCMSFWYAPNTVATNGFLALPGGYREIDSGSFMGSGIYGYWRSATQGSNSSAWIRKIYGTSTVVYRYNDSKSRGFSVRCIRD